MIELLPKMFKYFYARKTRTKPPLPISYTLGLTYKCNSRCATCRVYERDNGFELSVDQWRQIFKSIGKSPYWVTLTGGEVFLYPDIVELYYNLVDICKPAIVNIPTNGLLTDRIVDKVWQMAKINQSVKLVVNVSLDSDMPLQNDEIRGVNGYYNKAVATVKKLQELNCDNLSVGIHTVVSKYNIDELPRISQNLKALLKEPNNYITEIAENRVELKNTGLDISPDKDKYANAIECLTQQHKGGMLSNIKQAFRQRYYRNVIRWLNTGDHHLPCYAGYSSCQITPIGELWACCIKAESLGNLINVDFDFKELWDSDKADKFRMSHRYCYCPMANVSYTNMLMDIRSLIYVFKELL